MLSSNPQQDKKLQAALSAVRYTKSLPVLRPRHPIWDTANRDITGPRPGVAIVPMDTHSAKSIMGDMSLPMYKEFHEALCEYRLESLKR